MKGVSKYMTPAQINKEALLAGHDVLLFCIDVPGSIAAMVQAVEKGEISEREIDLRCRKSLALKEILEVNKEDSQMWDETRANREASRINLGVARGAMSWYKETSRKLDWDSCESLSLDMERSQENELAHHQLNFVGGQAYVRGEIWKKELLEKKGTETKDLEMEQPLISTSNQRVIFVNGIGIKAKNAFDMSPHKLELLDTYLEGGNCWLVWQGSPYALKYLKMLEKAEAVLLTYQEGIAFEKAAASVLLGETEAKGRLPVSL